MLPHRAYKLGSVGGENIGTNGCSGFFRQLGIVCSHIGNMTGLIEFLSCHHCCLRIQAVGRTGFLLERGCNKRFRGLACANRFLYGLNNDVRIVIDTLESTCGFGLGRNISCGLGV